MFVMKNVIPFPRRQPPIQDWAAPISSAALDRLAEAWGLDAWERGRLLRTDQSTEITTDPAAAEGRAAVQPTARAAMLLRLNRMLEALLICGSGPGEWIRHPRAEYDGRTPLTAMIEDPLELWLLCDRLESELEAARVCRGVLPTSGGGDEP